MQPNTANSVIIQQVGMTQFLCSFMSNSCFYKVLTGKCYIRFWISSKATETLHSKNMLEYGASKVFTYTGQFLCVIQLCNFQQQYQNIHTHNDANISLSTSKTPVLELLSKTVFQLLLKISPFTLQTNGVYSIFKK